MAWIVEAPLVLSQTGTGILPFTLPRPLMALCVVGAIYAGPTVAAFVMTGITEGRAGIRRLLSRYVLWRVQLRWYVFILLLITAVEVLGALLVPGAAASYQPLTTSLLFGYPLAFASTFFLGGPMGEEPGWRGFALPRMQHRYGPLLGSTILGVLWALWHFPLFWSGIWTPRTFANMWMFVAMITILTILMSFVFNHARGSLLLTMLMHASFNTFANRIVVPMFPAPVLEEYGLLPAFIGFGTLSLIVVLATRGRRGYQHHLAAQKVDLSRVAPGSVADRTHRKREDPAGPRVLQRERPSGGDESVMTLETAPDSLDAQGDDERDKAGAGSHQQVRERRCSLRAGGGDRGGDGRRQDERGFRCDPC